MAVTNLQHDGLIFEAVDEEAAAAAADAMTAASSAVLGYEQPVEVKPFDVQDVDDAGNGPDQ